MDVTDELIEYLKSKIETLAPKGQIDGRKEFYQRLSRLPRDKEFDILRTIFSCQIASDLRPHPKNNEKQQKINELDREIKQWKREEARKREKARKRYEYIQRQLARGKVPRVSPPDSMSLIAPRRTINLSSLNLWDLFTVLKHLTREEVRLLRSNFPDTAFFIRQELITEILYFFIGLKIETDSIKRELTRLRKSPHIKEYEEFTRD